MMRHRDDRSDPPSDAAHPPDDSMEHIQQLTTTWLRKPRASAEQVASSAPPVLPDRESIRHVAQLHHRQLVHAQRKDGSHYEVLKAQTEALRRFTLELPTELADSFMNMYTEESSAVEREWMARQRGKSVNEPLSPTLVNTLTFLVTILAVALAIYYVV
jgi:hypothetical protein